VQSAFFSAVWAVKCKSFPLPGLSSLSIADVLSNVKVKVAKVIV
jgi:hypothetical protein